MNRTDRKWTRNPMSIHYRDYETRRNLSKKRRVPNIKRLHTHHEEPKELIYGGQGSQFNSSPDKTSKMHSTRDIKNLGHPPVLDGQYAIFSGIKYKILQTGQYERCVL